MFRKRRESFIHIINKCRTAGACQKSLFRKFGRLRICNHIRTERRFDYRIKSKLFKSLYNLTELCVFELARDRRRNKCINLVFRIAFALFYCVDNVQYIRFIRDCAERTLIHAGTAGDTFIIINLCRLVLVHRYCFYLAGVNARAFSVCDCRKRTDLCASTAVDTFRFINMCYVVLIKSNSAPFAHVLTAVRKTASA